MSVTQPPKDTPFGLEPNVAAGLAYLCGLVGGLVMLLGGGTNRFVKWAAAQSITMYAVYIVGFIVFKMLGMTIILLPLVAILWMVWGLLFLVLWVWTTVTGFQGKEVRVPVIDRITESIFKSQLL
jgi:uncharacterized membrane protein